MHSLCYLPSALLALILALLSIADDPNGVVYAAPTTPDRAFRQRTVALSKRPRTQRNTTEWGLWASYQRNRLQHKYLGDTTLEKRGNGMNL